MSVLGPTDREHHCGQLYPPGLIMLERKAFEMGQQVAVNWIRIDQRAAWDGGSSWFLIWALLLPSCAVWGQMLRLSRPQSLEIRLY